MVAINNRFGSKSTSINGPLSRLFSGSRNPRFLDLGSIASKLGPSSRIEYNKDAILKYTQIELFQVVSDVNQYHKFLPWCTHSQIFENTRKSQNIVSTIRQANKATVEYTEVEAEMEVGFQSVAEKYVSFVTMEKPWMVNAKALDGSIFKELNSTWTLIPQCLDTPKTLVKFHVDFEFKSPLYAALSQVAMESVCQTMFKAFNDRCIEIYGYRP
ncbi:hypothetical protein H4219_002234 [Mycoemilia scoparia]|uniref:Coenzyme Q-binding protein COQ10 START domain-containing protein n=1 Tax=Mycoemilia scoparia TaxID=417184 RepID=A0A9W7ZYY2_9FUNG|nr:hypothetical protein H4219_002234 [Mycoemilia scoparia]